MTKLEYCPKCGQQSLVWNNINKWSCSNCDYVYYHNCAAAVAVIIRYQEEIFVTRRNQDPKKGLLDLAGGFVDPKESAEETCCRELYEELKMVIKPEDLKVLGTQPNIYHFKGIDYNTLDIFYEYNAPEKMDIDLELSEISEGIWIPLADFPIEELAFKSQKTFLSKYKKQGIS